MLNYVNEINEDLNMSLKHYYDAKTTEFFDENYKTINEKYIKSELSKCKVMVITANPIEKAVLHYKIVEKEKVKIIRILCETTVYYIFKWGKYWIAHIHQSQTGAGKDMGTNTTIGDALNFFTPNVIISLGVAFGIDYETQTIGDVLVSRRIFPYSENKRDEDDVKPDRTQDKTIDDWLHVRLENAVGFLDEVTYGDMLSGSSVMSSFEEKDRVCLGYTKDDYIIGGEMEGNAVFQYSKKLGIPGVVIKGICDWGVLKNGIYPENPDKEKKLKHSLQSFAMEQVVEKCKPLFNDKELFSSSKNIAVNKLKNKYVFCLCELIISMFLMMVNALYLLSTRNCIFYDSPYVWLVLPIVFLLIPFIVYLINNAQDIIEWMYLHKTDND